MELSEQCEPRIVVEQRTVSCLRQDDSIVDEVKRTDAHHLIYLSKFLFSELAVS